MNYEEFLLYIKENLPEYMDYYEKWQCSKPAEHPEEKKEEEAAGEYQAELHKVVKNNGIVLDGIILRKPEETVCPTIYLNSYFEGYQMGKPMAVIMQEIIYQYQNLKEEMKFEIVNVYDFKSVKNDIVLRLVNYERNRELLKDCPYKRFLDLAVTFRLIASVDILGVSSSLITNEEFESWNVEIEELYQIALFNTMREFPWQMDSLANMIVDSLHRKLSEEAAQEFMDEIAMLEKTKNGVNMFVLSNDTGVNGSVCILYDSVIKNFAKVQDCNIYILPSSVHEVMLVPENTETEPEFLEGLVQEANQSSVGLIDLLSDHIYYYDREKDKINIYGQN